MHCYGYWSAGALSTPCALDGDTVYYGSNQQPTLNWQWSAWVHGLFEQTTTCL